MRPTRPAIVSSALLAAAAFAAAPRASAIDLFEIQVYDGNIDRPLEPSLEIHANYVARGRRRPAYAGETPPNHLTHLTFEPALGLTDFWEVGAYLQLATDPGLDVDYAGWKVRSKWVLPRATAGAFDLGVNVEFSDVPHEFEPGRGAEMRPILGFRAGPVRFDVNPILSWTFAGRAQGVPDFEPAAKLVFDTGLGFGLGPEYYAGLGPIDHFARWNEQEQVLFATFDLLGGPIELNFGVGHGFTEASNAWTVKGILGFTF